MFTRIKELADRYQELMQELSEPETASDSDRFQKLMKEQSELLPIVETYHAYEKCLADKNDALQILEEERECPSLFGLSPETQAVVRLREELSSRGLVEES